MEPKFLKWAVVGSRLFSNKLLVENVCTKILAEGFGIASGGAIGADLLTLQFIAQTGADACFSSCIFLPLGGVSAAPSPSRPWLEKFQALGGTIHSYSSTPTSYLGSLFARNRQLVANSVGVICFLAGKSSGTWHTARYAAALGKPLIMFSLNSGRDLITLGPGAWVQVPWWSGAFFWAASASPQLPLFSDVQPRVKEITVGVAAKHTSNFNSLSFSYSLVVDVGPKNYMDASDFFKNQLLDKIKSDFLASALSGVLSAKSI